jgi:hypothetical protein
MRSLAALTVSVLVFALAGCGGSEKSVSPAQAAFENAELVPIGQGAFLRLRPGTQNAAQRRLLARLTAGKWVENGLVIPPYRVEALCRAHFLSREWCKARP